MAEFYNSSVFREELCLEMHYVRIYTDVFHCMSRDGVDDNCVGGGGGRGGRLLYSVLKIGDSLGQKCRSLAPLYRAAKFRTSSGAGKPIAKGIANEN